MRDDRTTFSRRGALIGATALLVAPGCSQRGESSSEREPPYNAMGERVGEVTARSAIVHTRLTAAPSRNNRGYSFPIWAHNLSREQKQQIAIPEGMRVAELEGSCPGKAGRVRLHYGMDAKLSQAASTEWVEVGPETDFTHQFILDGLASDSVYYYAPEIAAIHGDRTRRGVIGHFRTAPAVDRWAQVKFFVITGQDYACRDCMDGYHSYESMIRIGGDFLVSTGDSVYYDIDLPMTRSIGLARYHWHRMYSQPLLVKLFHKMSGYWLKDDHDAFEDDCWPAGKAHRVQPMTYQNLAPVFLEQVPMGNRTYRRVRWGKGLELWFVEGRDFRSPNSDPDGPSKTIWGPEQMQWLKRTLLASDADFRVLISPTCIVGPGGGPGRAHYELPEGGADSMGDGGFAYEGREFRHWAGDNKLNNLFIVNGDRHWQYHSVDPETGLNEFSCGALTDSHSSSDVAYSKKYHRFLRCKGGFLSVSLEGTEQQSRLAMRFHDVHGKAVYESARTGDRLEMELH